MSHTLRPLAHIFFFGHARESFIELVKLLWSSERGAECLACTIYRLSCQLPLTTDHQSVSWLAAPQNLQSLSRSEKCSFQTSRRSEHTCLKRGSWLKWLTVRSHFWEALFESRLWYWMRNFPQPFQTNADIFPEIMLPWLYCTLFSINYSLNIFSDCLIGVWGTGKR